AGAFMGMEITFPLRERQLLARRKVTRVMAPTREAPRRPATPMGGHGRRREDAAFLRACSRMSMTRVFQRKPCIGGG
ncbi:hypothetical protein QU38_00560, partial [Staphylococcus aureus]